MNQGAESQRNNPRYILPYFLKDHVYSGKIDINNYVYLNDRYNPHIDYHFTYLNLNGANIKFGKKDNLQSGEKVILWQPDVLAFLEQHYSTKRIYAEGDVQLLEILV